MQRFSSALTLAAWLVVVSGTFAQEPLTLREQFPPGYQYHVSSRVELTGILTPPANAAPARPGDKTGLNPSTATPKPVSVTGQSAIEYDERILMPAPAAADQGAIGKSIRIYRRIELQRMLGDQPQQSQLRPEVRRLVVLRAKNAKVPFSPDGPLTWGEIDLIRTDLFTPLLAGLLPERPVKVGDRWGAAAGAVAELTDMERIEEGGLECRLEEVATLAGRRHARISLAGTVRGVNEDGPTRQQLDGYFYFDLESNHLSYLTFRGVHSLLDAAGKEAGKIEGRFVLTRQAHQRTAELSDDALRNVTLEPNADNTQLLYDNPDLGVRLLYPRRWRIGMVRGPQVVIEEPNGNGLLLTLDPLPRVPTGPQFLNETRAYLEKQKAKILRVYPPQRLQNPPHDLEHFSLDVELAGQRALMDYFVLRQPKGGATIAARLLPADLANLQRDVDRIARSVTITGQQK